MPGLCLSQSELVEITGKVKSSAQIRVLRSQGFTVILRADGKPIVSRSHFEEIMNGGHFSNHGKDYQPNFSSFHDSQASE